MIVKWLREQEYRENQLLKWASPGLLVFLTAFFWAPSRDGLEAIYALSFFIPMLLVLCWRKPTFSQYGGWYTVIALVMGAYAALTTTWSKTPDPGYFVLQWVVLASWLCGVSWVANQKTINVQKLIDCLLIVGAVTGMSLMLVFYSQHSWYERLSGWSVLRNANVVGSTFGVLTLLAYLRWMEVTTTRLNIQYFLMMLWLALPLLTSQGRGALGALAIMLLAAQYFVKPSRQKLWIQLSLFILVVASVVFFVLEFPQIFQSRLEGAYRITIWTEAVSRTLQETPFFGFGLEKEGRIIIPGVEVFNHAHNAWLDAFYRTGLVGVCLMLGHLAYTLWHFKPTRELLPLYLWLMYGCLTCLVDNRGFFWEIDSKWFLYWIPAGLIAAIHMSAAKARLSLEPVHNHD